MQRSEQKLKGTTYLSRRQVLTKAKVSMATLARALRIYRGNRASYGQARTPGLRHKLIGHSLAVHRDDLVSWMVERRRIGCVVGVTKPLSNLMSKQVRRHWIRRLIEANARRRKKATGNNKPEETQRREKPNPD